MAKGLPPGFTIKKDPAAPGASPLPVAPAATTAPADVPAPAPVAPAPGAGLDPVRAAQQGRVAEGMDPVSPPEGLPAGFKINKEKLPGGDFRAATISVQNITKGIASLIGLPMTASAGIMKEIGLVDMDYDAPGSQANLMKLYDGLRQNPALVENIRKIAPGYTGERLKPAGTTERVIARVSEEVGAGLAALFPVFGIARLQGPVAAVRKPAETTARGVGRAIMEPFQKGGRETAKAVAIETGLAATAGGGAAVAQEIAPGSPGAEMTGLLAGAVAPTAIVSAGRGAGRLARKVVEPFTSAGLQRRVGKDLREAATDPASLQRAGETAEAADLTPLQREEAVARTPSPEPAPAPAPVKPKARPAVDEGPTDPSRRRLLRGARDVAAGGAVAAVARKLPKGVGAPAPVKAAAKAAVSTTPLDASPAVARIQRILLSHYPQAKLVRTADGSIELQSAMDDAPVMLYGDEAPDLDTVLGDVVSDIGGMVNNQPPPKGGYPKGQEPGTGREVPEALIENVESMQQSIGREYPDLKLEIGPEGNVQLRNIKTDEVLVAYGDEGVDWRSFDVDVATLIDEGLFDPDLASLRGLTKEDITAAKNQLVSAKNDLKRLSAAADVIEKRLNDAGVDSPDRNKLLDEREQIWEDLGTAEESVEQLTKTASATPAPEPTDVLKIANEAVEKAQLAVDAVEKRITQQARTKQGDRKALLEDKRVAYDELGAAKKQAKEAADAPTDPSRRRFLRGAKGAAQGVAVAAAASKLPKGVGAPAPVKAAAKAAITPLDADPAVARIQRVLATHFPHARYERAPNGDMRLVDTVNEETLVQYGSEGITEGSGLVPVQPGTSISVKVDRPVDLSGFNNYFPDDVRLTNIKGEKEWSIHTVGADDQTLVTFESQPTLREVLDELRKFGLEEAVPENIAWIESGHSFADIQRANSKGYGPVEGHLPEAMKPDLNRVMSDVEWHMGLDTKHVKDIQFPEGQGPGVGHKVHPQLQKDVDAMQAQIEKETPGLSLEIGPEGNVITRNIDTDEVLSVWGDYVPEWRGWDQDVNYMIEEGLYIPKPRPTAETGGKLDAIEEMVDKARSAVSQAEENMRQLAKTGQGDRKALIEDKRVAHNELAAVRKQQKDVLNAADEVETAQLEVESAQLDIETAGKKMSEAYSKNDQKAANAATDEREKAFHADSAAKQKLAKARKDMEQAEAEIDLPEPAPVKADEAPTGTTRRTFLKGTAAAATTVAGRKLLPTGAAPKAAAPKAAAEAVVQNIPLDVNPSLARIQRVLLAQYPELELVRTADNDVLLRSIPDDETLVQYGDAVEEAKMGVDVAEYDPADILTLDDVLDDAAQVLGYGGTSVGGVTFPKGQEIGVGAPTLPAPAQKQLAKLNIEIQREFPNAVLETGAEGNIQLRDLSSDKILVAYGDEVPELGFLDTTIRDLVDSGRLEPGTKARTKPAPETKPKIEAPTKPKKVPFRPSTAQATGDPGIAALEREVAGQSPTFAGRAGRQQLANDELLRDELDALAPAVDEPAEVVAAAVKTRVQTIKDALQRNVNRAVSRVQERTAAMKETPSKSASNTIVREEMNEAMDAATNTENNVWNKVDPNDESMVDMAPLIDSMNTLEAKVRKAKKGNLPEEILTTLGVGGREGPNTLLPTENIGEIAATASEITTQIRAARSMGDFGKATILGDMKTVMDDFINNLPIKDPSTLDRYNAAKEFTKAKNDVFSRTAVGDVLKLAKTGASKVPESATIETFFHTGKGASEDMDAFMKTSEGMSVEQAAKKAAGMDEGTTVALAREDGTLDDEIVKVFSEIGDKQRGRPEQAMLEVQKANGGGVLNPMVEHTGDLTHRMTEMSKYGKLGYDSVKEKTEKLLRSLRSGYGFAKEMGENIANNARSRGIPEEQVKKNVDNALAKYTAEHEKLPVYNRPQWLAREAAVAVGKKDWKRAEKMLAELDGMTQKQFEDAASQVRMGTDGKPIALGPDGKPIAAKPGKPVTTPARPKAVQAMRNFIIRDLAKLIDENGTLNAKLAKKWLENHRPVLRQHPELQAEFNTTVKMQERLDAVLGRQKRTLDKVNKGAAQFFLERDPDNAVTAALGSKNPAASFRELRNLVRNDPKAIAGLRRSLLDVLLAKSEFKMRLPDGYMVLKPEAILDFVKKNRRVFDALGYKADDIDRMLDIAEKARINVGGSSLRPGVPKDEKSFLSINQILSRMYGVQRGVVSSRFVGLEVGTRLANRWISKLNEKDLKDLMERALLDPKFAAEISKPVTAKNQDDILRTMRGHLLSNVQDEEK